MIGLEGHLGSYLGVFEAILGMLSAILRVQRAIFGAVEGWFGIILGVIWQIFEAMFDREWLQDFSDARKIGFVR